MNQKREIIIPRGVKRRVSAPSLSSAADGLSPRLADLSSRITALERENAKIKDDLHLEQERRLGLENKIAFSRAMALSSREAVITALETWGPARRRARPLAMQSQAAGLFAIKEEHGDDDPLMWENSLSCGAQPPWPTTLAQSPRPSATLSINMPDGGSLTVCPEQIKKCSNNPSTGNSGRPVPQKTQLGACKSETFSLSNEEAYEPPEDDVSLSQRAGESKRRRVDHGDSMGCRTPSGDDDDTMQID